MESPKTFTALQRRTSRVSPTTRAPLGRLCWSFSPARRTHSDDDGWCPDPGCVRVCVLGLGRQEVFLTSAAATGRPRKDIYTSVRRAG